MHTAPAMDPTTGSGEGPAQSHNCPQKRKFLLPSRALPLQHTQQNQNKELPHTLPRAVETWSRAQVAQSFKSAPPGLPVSTGKVL